MKSFSERKYENFTNYFSAATFDEKKDHGGNGGI